MIACLLVSPASTGISAARNLGILATSAPYVALMDSDDMAEPTFWEKAVCFQISFMFESLSRYVV